MLDPFTFCATHVNMLLQNSNCLNYSDYAVRDKVMLRSCTYVSHTRTYEVMFPQHQPQQCVIVFHHRTMTNEVEGLRVLQTQISKFPITPCDGKHTHQGRNLVCSKMHNRSAQS